jgi:hypothetical protein
MEAQYVLSLSSFLILESVLTLRKQLKPEASQLLNSIPSIQRLLYTALKPPLLGLGCGTCMGLSYHQVLAHTGTSNTKTAYFWKTSMNLRNSGISRPSQLGLSSTYTVRIDLVIQANSYVYPAVETRSSSRRCTSRPRLSMCSHSQLMTLISSHTFRLRSPTSFEPKSICKDGRSSLCLRRQHCLPSSNNPIRRDGRIRRRFRRR